MSDFQELVDFDSLVANLAIRSPWRRRFRLSCQRLVICATTLRRYSVCIRGNIQQFGLSNIFCRAMYQILNIFQLLASELGSHIGMGILCTSDESKSQFAVAPFDVCQGVWLSQQATKLSALLTAHQSLTFTLRRGGCITDVPPSNVEIIFARHKLVHFVGCVMGVFKHISIVTETLTVPNACTVCKFLLQDTQRCCDDFEEKFINI